MSETSASTPSSSSSNHYTTEDLQFMMINKGLTRTMMAPIDRIKFLLQCQGELHRLGCIERPSRTTLKCFQQVITFEGAPSLFRGNLIHVGSILPTALAQIYVGIPAQQLVFDMLPHYTSGTFFLSSLVSGVAGAATTCMLTYPFDFLRFRMAMDVKSTFHARYEFRSSWDIITNPSMMERPQSMYRGLGLFLGGSFMYKWIFGTSLQLVSPLMPTDEDADEHLGARAALLAVGYLATSAATMLLYPLDTVRRRMMFAALHEEGQYHTVGHCARTIFRTEGVPGFFRGATLMLGRGVFATGFMVLTGLTV